MRWLGEYPEDFTTVVCMFTTHDGQGGPVAPLSAFEATDVIIYKNGSATQKTSTNGVTMTSPFDSITGLHCVVIDTSNDTGDGGFWVAGAVYTLVLSPDTETVDGKTALNVIGQFGIELAEVLRPTTAGRQLDVSAGGEAGIDWANIGSPTTAVNLSATNIDVDQVVASVSGAVGSVTGLTAADVAAIKAKTDNLPTDPADASVIAARFDTIDTSILDLPTNAELATALGTADDAVLAQVALVKAKTDLIPAAPAAVGDIPTAAAIADAVWDEAQADHVGVGTFGITASEIADILVDTAEIGAAGAGLTNINLPNQTMDIVGNITGNLSGSVGSVTGLTASNLDATISSRASAADMATALGYIDTEVAAILADTNELQTDWVNGGRLDLLIDAIKAKTDNLPAAPAATGDIPSAATIADAVWDEDATAHQTQGTFGQAIGDPVADTNTIYKAVVTDAAGATVGVDVVAIKAETAAILDDTDDIGVAGAGLTALATQASVNAIDDFLDTEIATIVSAVAAIEVDTQDIQARLPAALIGGRIDATVGAMQANTLTAAATAADFTTEVQTGLATAANLAIVGTAVDAIQAKTDNLPSDPADESLIIAATTALSNQIGVGGAALTAVPWNATWDAEVQSEVTDALVAYDPPTNAEMEARTLVAANYATAAAITALNNLSAAQVNAEVLDVLTVDTFAEPGQEAPAATNTLAVKLGYLFKAWRNKKTQTTTVQSLYADDGVTVDQKLTVSDDGTTFTSGEVGTGP